MQNNQGYIVNFSQSNFINYLKSNDKDLDPHKRAEALALLEKYNGLCDIICNHITQENLLSDQSKLEEYLQKSNISIAWKIL